MVSSDVLSSKEILERAGISRSTLNNYITLGILPKPVLRPADGRDGRAPRVGYFPRSVLDRLKQVSRLKRRGYSIAEIVNMLPNAADQGGTGHGAAPGHEAAARAAASNGGGGGEALRPRAATRTARPPGSAASAAGAAPGGRGGSPLMLTMGDFHHPAYLVNNKFEVEWANSAAEREIFRLRGGLPSDLTERNLLGIFAEAGADRPAQSWEGVLRFHVAIAKKRLSKAALFSIDLRGDAEEVTRLGRVYDAVEAVEPQPLLHTEVDLAASSGEARPHNLYATFFREGIFFAYVPVVEESDGLLNFLSRRDLVIRDLLQSRRPYLTPLTVLVADIQESVKICAELPPEEYFELINHVWGSMASLLRKYYGTYGKHVGDGMVYYFFPQPDCNYIMNAIACALEMREIMRTVSRKWQNRKNWVNDLRLNIGLDEGEEWFGTYRTPTHLEFTALGDTINRSSRLSDFAREGTVWVTKNMLGKLPSKLRETVRYGIRRRTESGETVIMDSSYSRISNLIDLQDSRYGKFHDIAVLPVTEILDLERDQI
jgi:class 3 adenylate cyclase/DNA-binding transcriptional MerR regulator